MSFTAKNFKNIAWDSMIYRKHNIPHVHKYKVGSYLIHKKTQTLWRIAWLYEFTSIYDLNCESEKISGPFPMTESEVNEYYIECSPEIAKALFGK